MEKKYYLRGLGLGIIVTAVIMGIALSGGTKKREMTDEEVIARAKELGMTEDTRLLEPSSEEEGETETEEEDAAAADTPVKLDVAVKPEAELEEKKAETPADSAGADAAPKTEQKPTVDTPEPVQTSTSAATTETKPKADTNEMNKQDDEEKPAQAKTEENSDALPASGGTKSITIVSGDSSYTVAKKLETTGVVSSASSYDTYLCEHGYDKKLRPGTFQIPAGATEEQIAKIVTGQ